MLIVIQEEAAMSTTHSLTVLLFSVRPKMASSSFEKKNRPYYFQQFVYSITLANGEQFSVRKYSSVHLPDDGEAFSASITREGVRAEAACAQLARKSGRYAFSYNATEVRIRPAGVCKSL